MIIFIYFLRHKRVGAELWYINIFRAHVHGWLKSNSERSVEVVGILACFS